MSAVENIIAKIMEEGEGENARKCLGEMAKLAESSERYEDMCMFMRQLVLMLCKSSTSMTTEERNLLSVAYKNVIGTRRASFRVVSVDSQENSDLSTYFSQVQKELTEVCANILDLLENQLIKNENEKGEAKVFFLKMTADYYRYLCEATQDENNKTKAAQFYEEAHKLAQVDLKATNPIRLGLALNYSVCYYEILKDHKKACELAKTAFDEAISKLDKLQESDYKDSTLIMQLLRDNLTLWTSNETDEGNEVRIEDFSDEEIS